MEHQTSKVRYVQLDQTRGLAIAAMIVAHFGPGFYERLDISGVLLDSLLFFGRLATPSFIIVYGITLGLVYLPRYMSSREQTSIKLFRRSATVLSYAILISIPAVIDLVADAEPSDDDFTWQFALCLYSVLLFYTLAMLITPLVLDWIKDEPMWKSIAIGSALILIGTKLAFSVWPYTGPGPLEYTRLLLVSGKYGLLTCYGCAACVIPIGYALHQQIRAPAEVERRILYLSFATIGLSLSASFLVGARQIGDYATQYGNPPQFWYIFLAGGLSVLYMITIAKVHIPFYSRFLENTGKHPLQIYAAHEFVLPVASWLKDVVDPTVAVVVPLATFLLYWVLKTGIVRTSSQAGP
ncbi:DUF1624 domain-containing protein [Roseiconus nitratireducens]|uniref:DUF1624 domain-containing protein n=1 Tax=Roseiconus nitratireducens TaxID=2605748 RepID=A0A5M6D5J4_9BACT|nr:heparan-alpha-glucosaminide N-acetyltransferase domain-containing protein [Roseiconus nitratireducens]KAA5542774.1 DUF1624 domain-containing protein [Roseiconus nitratireducens]